MRSDRLSRRLAHLEASLTGVTGDTTSLVELTAAVEGPHCHARATRADIRHRGRGHS